MRRDTRQSPLPLRIRTRPPWSTGIRTWSITGVLLMALACSGNEISGPSPVVDTSQLFWTLTLNHHALTVATTAPYDTVTLIATPRGPSGDAITTTAPIIFKVANNDTSVLIRSTENGQGVVHVHTTSGKNNVKVIAMQTIGNITLTDTATFNIVKLTMPQAPRLVSFSMQPAVGDSAKVDCSGVNTKTLTVIPQDSAGNKIDGSLVRYRSANSAIAKISADGVVSGVQPGKTTLFAETYIYGVTKTDSVEFTVGEPLLQVTWVLDRTPSKSQAPMPYFQAADVTIGIGGIVDWQNGSSYPIDIIFDDTTHVKPTQAYKAFAVGAPLAEFSLTFSVCPATTGANISLLDPPTPSGAFVFIGCQNVAARMFLAAGTYHYHSTLAGITGSVTVR